jgi:hypothetical protein
VSGLRQIVRLREARLASAGLALTVARDGTLAAERERIAADDKARRARNRLDTTRDEQCRNLADAGMMLALLDQRRFEHSVAHSARNDAVATVEDCMRVEALRRAEMIRAQSRRDALVDHTVALESREARRAEDRAAEEEEDDRRPS